MAGEACEGKKSLRLLLLGGTGAGKSCTGNTILNANDDKYTKYFKDGQRSFHNTKENEEFTREILGRQVTIVDTPGLGNRSENSKEIIEEIKAAIENSSESYDALLLVVNIFQQGLEMDDLTLQVINDISKNITHNFWRYAVLVFSFEDTFWELQEKERSKNCMYEQLSVRDYVNKSRTSGHRYAIGQVVKKLEIEAVTSVNNMERDKQKIKEKVKELIKAVDFVRSKNGNKKFCKEDLNIKSCSVL